MSGGTQAWYHVVLTTYGAWLPGDERGFRTRHHRQHVEGDYTCPPPLEEFRSLRASSAKALRGNPVAISPALRPVIGAALDERLAGDGSVVLCIAVASQHAHLLARLRSDNARFAIGNAKRHATYVLRQQGWSGPLWGRRSKEVRIRDRGHQLNTFRYILAHREQGAWTWSFRDEMGRQGV